MIQIKHLRTKFFLILIPAILVTIFAILTGNLIMFRELHSEYKRLAEDKSFTIAENIRKLANRNLEFLPFDSLPGMNIYLSGVLKNNPDYKYCFIADKEMNIRYHSDEKKLNRTLDKDLYPGLYDNMDMSERTFSVGDCYEMIISLIKSDEIIGTIHIGIKRSVIDSNITRMIIITVSVLLISFGVFTLVVYIFLQKNIIGPITDLSDTAHRLAGFDLTVHTDTKGKADEIGTLTAAINKAAAEFRTIVRDVKISGKTLADSSARMTENITAISSSAEEISANVQGVSETTEQMSENVNAVATSIEEMSASVNEVGKNANQGADIARTAVEMTEKAGHTMVSLGNAASQIDQVTEVIKKIADKTNLLALNAHIEAASAGEAGKGFAVVANEIKEFARQSAQAASDIAERISLMQESAEAAVSVIREVSEIINSISLISETISLALEEQMAAANDIASNMAQANTRASDIAVSMEELSKGANEVSKSVGLAAGHERGDKIKAEDPAGHIDSSAAQIAELAGNLLELVEKFRVEA